MAKVSEQNGFEVYTISSQDGSTHASFVPARGGAGSSIIVPSKDGPRELLFLHDWFWDHSNQHIPGGWPFLFPVCARIERDGKKGDYLYDGRVYNLPSHGFGPKKEWDVVEHANDSVTLQLKEDEETLKEYPFQFTVTLKYRVEPSRLVCEQTYHNTGGMPMPYYAGFHPYFLTPSPEVGKEETMLDYSPKRRFVYNDRLTDLVNTREVPDLPTAVTNEDINENLTQVGKDKETRLILPDGLTIHMAAEGVEDPDLFPYVQLYTMPEKPFFCIEPWMGYPNAINAVKGARWLEPGRAEHGLLCLWTTS